MKTSNFFFRKLKVVLVGLLTVTLLAPGVTGTQLFASERPSSVEFVAKQAIPAVVSIRVSANRPRSRSMEDPMDLFVDDFWQHFFGGSRRGMRPHQRKEQPIVGQGSGFFVSTDGYILTNNHVVRDADRITVVMTDGREFEGKVVGQDRSTDIAMLRNAIALMDPGSKVNLTVQRGGRTKHIRVEVGSHPDNIAETGHTTTSLGVDVTELAPETAQQLGYIDEQGVVITKVTPGSLGDRVGLRRGQLILGVNHKKVTTPEQFKHEVATAAKQADKRVLLLLKQGSFTRFLSFKLV